MTDDDWVEDDEIVENARTNEEYLLDLWMEGDETPESIQKEFKSHQRAYGLTQEEFTTALEAWKMYNDPKLSEFKIITTPARRDILPKEQAKKLTETWKNGLER